MINAGRELDSLVAEHVMGVVWDESRCRVCGWPLSELPIEGCTLSSCSMRPPPIHRADEQLPYSTDIDASQLVLSVFWSWNLRTSNRNVHKYDCTVWGEGLTPSVGSAYMCDTAPLAICVAALKAVGVEVSE
jgi:hypothetical protein